MIRKFSSVKPGHVRVVFELPSCVWADRVFLTGDFNNWSQTDTPLHQNRSGVWQVAIEAPVGQKIEFRYVIDGQWRTDFHADGFTDNIFGTQNSVVVAELPEIEPDKQDVGSSLVRESRSFRTVVPGTVSKRSKESRRLNVAA